MWSGRAATALLAWALVASASALAPRTQSMLIEDAGAAEGDAAVEVTLALALREGSELDLSDLLHDISDPKSELYGKFVDHATVNELIDGHHKEGVSTWLRAHGFDVREATVSLVHAVAPAAVVGASFNCTVRRNADISTGSLVSASCRPAVHLPAELQDGVTGATFALAPRPAASGDAGLRARKPGDAMKRRAIARALGLIPGAAPRPPSAPRVSSAAER